MSNLKRGRQEEQKSAKKPILPEDKRIEEQKQPKALKQTQLFFVQPKKRESTPVSSQEFQDFQNPEIRIVSWNVNGLRACMKKESFNEYIKTSPDILCFNETKLQDQHVDQIKQTFEDYKYQYWACSQKKKGYSGVAILSKVRPINVTYGIGKEKHDQEGRAITCEFQGFFVVSTYVPNAGQGLSRVDYRTQEWDVDMHEYLRQLESGGKPFIWLGDLNVIHQECDIHNIRDKEHIAGCSFQERQSFGNFLQQGYVDSFRHLYPHTVKFSWYSTKNPRARRMNQGWRLDYAIVSQSLIEKIVDSKIHDDVMGSDHHPIELILVN